MPKKPPPRRSLCVEDKGPRKKFYRRYFAGRYDMAFARTGADAMKQLDAFMPDILVLDMRLPDTDGIALLQKIRQQSPALPVVVTTAYVSMEPLMRVLDLGHSGYLVKPFDLNDLAARIDAVG